MISFQTTLDGESGFSSTSAEIWSNNAMHTLRGQMRDGVVP
jgi:hypothetical protein